MALIPLSLRLKSGDPDKRLAAFKELAASKDAGADTFVAALSDASMTIRTLALKTLVERGDERAVDFIAAQLREKGAGGQSANAQLARSGREAKLNELGSLLVRMRGPKSMDALIGLLDDRDQVVTAIARRCLLEIGHIRALPALLASGCTIAETLETWPNWNANAVSRAPVLDALERALASPDSGARERAVTALGDIPDDRSAQLLVRALTEATDRVVRWTTAEALAKRGATEAIEPLAALLREDGCSPAIARALDTLGWKPADPADRAALAISLANWRDVRDLGTAAVGPIVRALETHQFEFGQTEMAIRALRDAKDPRAVSVLLAEIRENGACAIDAAAALGNIADPRAIPALAQATLSPQPQLRTTAARALGNFDDEYAREALLAALKHPDADLRIAAATGLGGREASRDPRIRQPLMDALNDGNIAVVGAVARALGKAGAAAAAAPLSGFVRVPPLAAAAVEALQDLLARAAFEIDDETLKSLARLKLKDLDTTELRRLADEETARRAASSTAV